MATAEIKDLRPVPKGWQLRFVGPLCGWEAVAVDHERGDGPTGALGPVFFSGKDYTEVLDLVLEYESVLGEKLRLAWISEAREVLELVEAFMWLRMDGPAAESFAEMHRMVRRLLEDLPCSA